MKKFISILKGFIVFLKNQTKKQGFWGKISFFTLGIASTLWFVIRVLPKPSRAAYPCMRAAAPLASSFVIYIIGLTTLTFTLKKVREKIMQSKYTFAALFGLTALTAGIITIVNTNTVADARSLAVAQNPNEPVGEAKGIFPGRVVWVHDNDATDINCSNEEDDYWSDDANADQDVISAMLSEGLRDLTGTSGDATAWDSLFHYFNRSHGKGNVGYTSGEKIVIKINLNGEMNSFTSTPPKNINTSPQICYAILEQLVNVAGVAESDISIGDPNIECNDVTFNKCHTAFPDINYWGTDAGRTQAEQSSAKVFFASDGSASDWLPQAYVDAAYMINLPVLKKHHRAGISLCSKNHFGSIGAYTGGAWHLHPSLPCPEATGVASNGDYGVYRGFVDIMGHKDLGGKTILYLIDGLWGSTNWGHPPVKWAMSPFDNKWPNSLFLSQDPVAIESVGYDFLFNEFDEDHPTEGEFVGDDKGPFPQFAGTDDFLHQAADITARPVDIDYDPENDGSILGSLGTHEHWNNATDKKYSRNLNPETGTGIELYYVDGVSSVKYTNDDSKLRIFPNPASDYITVALTDFGVDNFSARIYTLNGQLVFSESFNNGSDIIRQKIQINNLDENVYLLTIDAAGKKFSKTFVKSE